MTLAINCTCGAHLELDDRFAGQTIQCPDCKKSLQAPSLASTPLRTSGLALASLTLALIGAFTVIGTMVAVVLGFLALRQIRRQPDLLTGKRFALAGMVLGALLTAVSVVAYLKTDLFGLDRLLRSPMWAGKLDYSEAEIASGAILLKRPNERWGHYRPRDTQDNLGQPTRPEFVILVDLRDDAHAIAFSFPKGEMPDNFEDYRNAAIPKFLQSELVRLLIPKRSSLPEWTDRDRKEIPGENGRREEALLLDVRLGKYERTFLMRFFPSGEEIYVVAAGTRKNRFRAMEVQLQQIVDSFKESR
jgi:uncharacterized protein DUF4190